MFEIIDLFQVPSTSHLRLERVTASISSLEKRVDWREVNLFERVVYIFGEIYGAEQQASPSHPFIPSFPVPDY